MIRLFRLPDSIVSSSVPKLSQSSIQTEIATIALSAKSMFHFSEKWVESSLNMDEFGDDLRSNEDLMLIHGFALLDNIHDTYGTVHLAVTLFELN